MTTKLIPPPPPTVPIGTVTRDGKVLISQDWAIYLTVGLLQRVGGYNGLTPAELSALIEALGLEVDALEGEVDSLQAMVAALSTKSSPMPEDPMPPEDVFIVVQQPAPRQQQVVLMLGGDTYIEETYMLR